MSSFILAIKYIYINTFDKPSLRIQDIEKAATKYVYVRFKVLVIFIFSLFILILAFKYMLKSDQFS
jgi:hypothetical protein